MNQTLLREGWSWSRSGFIIFYNITKGDEE